MNTWKVILATLVLFGAGVVTGGLLVQHAFQARNDRGTRAPGFNRQGPPSARGMRYEFLRRMGSDLDLTPEQRERIDQILKASQDLTRKTLRDEFQKTKAAFREVLTPEQQGRFDELIKRSQRVHESKRPAGSGEGLGEKVSVTNTP